MEDDPALHELLVRTFARHEHLEMIGAFDGVEGLALARTERPDLIVLDLMLPKLDGRDVLRELKADPTTQAIPVLILSARGAQIDRHLGLQLGAEDYLDKPYSLPILMHRIDQLLWKRTSGQR